MNNDDIFQALGQRWSQVTLHNVRLLDVQPDPDGYEAYTVEYQGETRTVAGGGRWSDEWSPHRHQVGRVGYLVPADPVSGIEMPKGACYFREYIDQSLRRAPEFDWLQVERSPDGRRQEVIGWRCDRLPGGFRAPLGLIPGEGGAFVPDQTEVVTLRVPPEFIRACRSVERSPEAVLRGFVGDLAGISNFVNNPRADGYGSNGSDERDYAETWLNRAYGMDRVDLDALDAEEEARQERQYNYDDLNSFLDDYLDRGGDADTFLNAVQAIVDKQEKKDQD